VDNSLPPGLHLRVKMTLVPGRLRLKWLLAAGFFLEDDTFVVVLTFKGF
jgi:hypothetical protein